MLELPVCDGRVPHQVLVDAIAAEFAWPIIGRFFTRTVYRQLDVQRKANSLSLWRGTVCLADGLSETQYPLGADRPWQGEDAVWQQVHERVGWTVFLQELWGRPYWPSAQFYDPQEREVATTRRRADCGWLVVEVTENLPDVEAGMQELTVVPTVSGVAVGTITIPTPGGFLYAHELRVEITKESGYELCRAAVREGLLGRPLAGPASLRVRLTATAAQHTQAGPQPAVPANPAFAPGMASALRRVLSTDERSIVIGRRAHGAIGTSVSRRAALPAAAAHELIAAAAVVGEPVLQTPTTHALTAPVIYAPDVIWRSVRPAPPVAVTRANNAVKRRGPLSSLLSPQITRTLQRTYKAALHVKDHIRSRMAVTERLPILMYHRVAPAGAPRLARYRVTPAAFEAQLQYLHDNGFYSVGLEDWRKAMVTQQPLPGRAVLLTFDDGTLDFFTYAWPLLQRYGFSAIVFLVAEEIGGSNRWDRAYGEAVPLLGWEHICQLQAVGIEFGSHSATHARLTALAPAGVVREGARSRMLLERELGVPVTAFSYPHGAEDQVVQHLIGACGYIFGLSCRAGLSGFQDPLLALPRIEVTDSDSLQSLVVL
jgi:peptidoglycan/xylan/chitin deacetylase (PgdA/CDA1 family)